jgi:hypothetical protein
MSSYNEDDDENKIASLILKTLVREAKDSYPPRCKICSSIQIKLPSAYSENVVKMHLVLHFRKLICDYFNLTLFISKFNSISPPTLLESQSYHLIGIS